MKITLRFRRNEWIYENPDDQRAIARVYQLRERYNAQIVLVNGIRRNAATIIAENKLIA